MLSEDGTVKFHSMISLQKIAMSKIVTSMWMNGNIQQYLEEYNFCMDFVENKISTLELPSTFTKTLIKTFKAVGNSILHWIQYHDQYVFNRIVTNNNYLEGAAIEHIDNIKWNSQGRIDYGQTAKVLMANRENGLSDELKYRLACTYCLEDEIAIIAPKVVNSGYLDDVKECENRMVYFWTANVTGDPIKFPIATFFSTPEYYLCLNEVSIRYVSNILSADDKSEFITSYGYLLLQDFSTIVSLLSTLNYEQQQDVFRRHSFRILREILHDWLWEDYFLPTALHVLNIMTPAHYVDTLINLLLDIDYERENGRFCDQYKSAFKMLCRESSIDMKDMAWPYLRNPLICRYKSFHVDLIESVLKDFSAEQKKNLILGDISFLGRILWEGKIDHFIKFCEASPEEINYFQNNAMHLGNLESKFLGYQDDSDSDSENGDINRDVKALIIKWCCPSKDTMPI